MANEGTIGAEDQERALVALSARYCWDSEPDAALAQADRVIVRTMDIGTWEDLLALERVFGHDRLVHVLQSSSAGALTPRSWSFWHVRLGLADSDHPPPPLPTRRIR